MKRFKKISIKTLSVFLAVLIAVISLPLNAMAEGVSSLLDSLDDPIHISESKIFELKEARSASTKTFRLEDGSYYLAQYDSDVHYVDDNGEWQDIDNTLSKSGGEIVTKNEKIKFAKKTTGNGEIFTLHNGNKKLSLSLDDAKKRIYGKITNNESTLPEDATELQKMTVLDKISASVLYEDILDGVDLEYVINGSSVKENIIVKEKAEAYSYSFTLSLNNLYAELNSLGEVEIKAADSGECVYLIPAPVMWDSAEVVSDKVTPSLTYLENGKYTLTISADSEWMNSNERVYPITIDPPLYTNTNSQITDIYVSSSGDTTDATYLMVDESIYAYWKLATLPTLPESAYITNAEFTMESSAGARTDAYVAVYGVKSAWSSSLTWSQINSVTNPKGKLADNYTDFQRIEYTTENGHSGGDGRYTWNVTPIVKDWYASGNHGLAFATVPGTNVIGNPIFLSNNYESATERPKLCISYRDMKGLESYWSFTSQSAGFAGTAYINNATGSLTLAIPTLTTTDALMPITPTLYYNSCVTPTYGGGSSTAYEPFGYGVNLNILETVNRREQYYYWTDGDGTDHYFTEKEDGSGYVDEDGLKLEMSFDDNYVCRITDSDNNVREFHSPNDDDSYLLSSITDKSGNEVGFLYNSASLPTTVLLKPNGHTSGTTQLTLSYNESSVLTEVRNPTANEAMRFYYVGYVGSSSNTSGGYLSRIEYLSGNSVVATAGYTYDDNTEKLNSITNNLTGYKLTYQYDSSNMVTRVSESATSGSITTQGQAVSLSYGTSNTIIRTSGSDDTLSTADDLLATYSFDSSGRAVSCYTTNLTGDILYGASNGEYVGEEQENAKNNLKSSVQTSQHSSNHLINGGLERWTSDGNPVGWTTSGSVSKTSQSHDGRYAARINVPINKTNYAGLSQEVWLDPGRYFLSLCVKTQDTIEANALSVYLIAEGQVNSSYYSEKTVPINVCNASNGYVFAYLEFSVPERESYKLYIDVSVTRSVSSSQTLNIDIDNVMLSKSATATGFDMIEGGHFEYFSEPFDYWLEAPGLSARIEEFTNSTFGDVLEIYPEFVETGYVYQVVYEATEAELAAYNANEKQAPVTYTLSGWGKGSAQAYSADSVFGLLLEVKYHNGTEESAEDPNEEDRFLPFNKGITDWQFVSGAYTTDPERGMVKKITVYIYYDKNPGVGYFDSISLIRDDSRTESYEYNENGYVSSYKSGENSVQYSYNEDNDLIYTVSSNNYVVFYEYNAQHLVTKEIASKFGGELEEVFSTGSIQHTGSLYDIYTVEYYYNSYGLLTSEHMKDKTTNDAITNYYEYITTAGSHIFGTLKSSSDSEYKTTYYFYDDTNGRLMAVISPDGNGVSYSYDNMGNMVQALPASLEIHTEGTESYISETGAESVSYTYDSVTKRLTTITTATTTYSFTYDTFGNTAEITAGGNTLAEYTYNDNNGKLDTLTYGNGLVVKYFYDALDRVSKVQYNNGSGFVTKYTYEYDGAGRLKLMYDAETSTRTMYSYDTAGRLLKSYNYKSGKILNATSYTYDAKSRVTSMVYSLDYIYDGDAEAYAWTNTYTYDENTDLLSEMNISMSSLTATLNYTYDGLNMLDSKTAAFFHNGTAAFYNRVSYEYGDFRTSNVYSYTSETGRSSTGTLSTTEYNFTYDENGNITLVRDGNGVIQNKYYYDNLGQLIREDNRAKNKTYVWTYDNAGNRTSEKTYALTTGTLGAVTSTKNYSYSTSAWGDLLTFDGRNYITYDEIGNPTRIYQDDGGFYYGYELTWEGRQLTAYTYFEEEGSYEYYDTPTTYTYNADGIRTSKTTDLGTKYEYLLDGSRIVSQTWGDNIFVFIYDENGSPIGINYTSAESNALNYFVSYYFEKNLQGDIIAIYNSSGTKVGTYTYDAWGNVTQTYLTTNNTDKHIVNSNPFRYRGYYYDSDTRLYYLQTRYYDPANGRFLNGDSALYSNMLGFNLFAYCYNNPINYMDPYGESATAVATWTASAWWLTLVDGPIPVGDIIFWGGVAIIGISTCVIADKIDDNRGVTFEEESNTDGETIPEPVPKPDDDSEDSTEDKNNKLPTKSDPNSDKHLYDEKGLKQTRHYGQDGRAEYDIDYHHPGKNHKFPHKHKWSWHGDVPSRGEAIELYLGGNV